MFQIKNIIISFFVIATAISGTHAKTCLADKNDGCPPSFSSRGTFSSSNKGSSLDKKLICSNNNDVNFNSDTIDCPKSHKKHRSMIEGKSCMVSGNTACPTNFASNGSINENTLCCLTIGEDSSCGSIIIGSGSTLSMCAEASVKSIPSHKKHRSMIEGKSCLVAGSSTACPTGFTTNGFQVAGYNVCCLTNGEDTECGGVSIDSSGSSTPMCAGASVESIPSSDDTSSAGSASIFALTTSFIITPFVIMMLMN